MVFFAKALFTYIVRFLVQLPEQRKYVHTLVYDVLAVSPLPYSVYVV